MFKSNLFLMFKTLNIEWKKLPNNAFLHTEQNTSKHFTEMTFEESIFCKLSYKAAMKADSLLYLIFKQHGN